MSWVYFAPSIHRAAYKADFSDCLIAQHRCSLSSLRSAQRMRWSCQDSGKVSPGNEILMDRKALPLALARGRRVRVTLSMGSGEESQNTHSGLQERRQTESNTLSPQPCPRFPSEVSLSPPPSLGKP
ncbi:hypothetical protein PBY51_022934 [Eleginops maclovinus]|nr:hypothetical protein PBY51_022934 [Eleginops maclovinus]